MINMGAEEIRDNPFPTFAVMREKHPVCQIEPGNLWALTRYSDVKYALKNHQLFSSAAIKSIITPEWLSPDTRRDLFVLTEDPPIHKVRRSVINKTFTNRVVKRLAPLMRDSALALIDDMTKKDDVDFIEDFAFPFSGSIINNAIGVEKEQRLDLVKSWVNTIEKFTVDKPGNDVIKTIENEIRGQVLTFGKIIEDRKKRPQNDFVTKLVNTSSTEFLLTDDMRVNILDVLIRGGYVTTINSLGHIILLLSRNPDLFHLLQANPDKIPLFIEEVLRLFPPILGVLRETTQLIDLHGVIIPKQARVILYMAAANRDPAVFDNPDDIDLSRPNIKEHLAFGSGPHVCSGMFLARLEMQIALETILQNVNHIECPIDNSELEWDYSILVRGLKRLPVRLT